MVQFLNAHLAEAAPLQTDRVHSKGMSVSLCRRFRKRQHVSGNCGTTANVRMCTNADKLMNWAECAHARPVFHGDVAAERGGIGHDHMIANETVMGDVHISHDQ